jgi:hypothetical protein
LETSTSTEREKLWQPKMVTWHCRNWKWNINEASHNDYMEEWSHGFLWYQREVNDQLHTPSASQTRQELLVLTVQAPKEVWLVKGQVLATTRTESTILQPV